MNTETFSNKLSTAISRRGSSITSDAAKSKMNKNGNIIFLIMTIVLLVLLSSMVQTVAGQFFDLWAKRPAYSGGYSQSMAFR